MNANMLKVREALVVAQGFVANPSCIGVKVGRKTYSREQADDIIFSALNTLLAAEQESAVEVTEDELTKFIYSIPGDQSWGIVARKLLQKYKITVKGE